MLLANGGTAACVAMPMLNRRKAMKTFGSTSKKIKRSVALPTAGGAVYRVENTENFGPGMESRGSWLGVFDGIEVSPPHVIALTTATHREGATNFATGFACSIA